MAVVMPHTGTVALAVFAVVMPYAHSITISNRIRKRFEFDFPDQHHHVMKKLIALASFGPQGRGDRQRLWG